tara:strand:+ start:58 stop:1212 length:1155 start_codon:yes stop_codon:yes gene_type:complete
MLKTIPKSSISKRAFQVNKAWTVTSDDYPIISGSFTTEAAFDKETAIQQNGLYTYPLFKSIKSKYYDEISNPLLLHGVMENIGERQERVIGTTGYVITIPQKKYGEGIKPKSLILRDLTNAADYSDDGFGNITSRFAKYILSSIDFETGVIVIVDSEGETFTGTLFMAPGVSAMDMESGLVKMTFGTDTDTIYVMNIDFEEGTIQFEVALEFDGQDIDQLRFGNVIYSEGLVILNDTATQMSSYTLDFKSTKTISELEILLTAKAGEFNVSQSPSAVTMEISGSYETEITPDIGIVSGTQKITIIDDISKSPYISGSYNPSISGSWDDYDASASYDPTGSYLAPFISTIGIYDKDGDMIAIAKLPQPIKNLPDYDMNFLVRLDT